MVNRYETIPIVKGQNGKRVVRSILYPPIPRNISDIYLLTTVGDRLDLLAMKYYEDVGYWWIIAEANGVGKGNMALPAGIQLRVPTEISEILSEYRTLNQ